jgi:DNA-binding transcriptional LysR family regulator
MADSNRSPQRRYFKELRFRQFRAFREVARTMSFAAAADALRISRPSLWQQVRALEEELGAALVRTENQQLSLTEDGALLVELIKPLVEEFDSIRTMFADRRANVVRRLRVATTSSLLANELQQPVQHYAQEHPAVRFSFVERPSKEAFSLLESGEADLAVVGMLDTTPRPEGFVFDEWLSYPFVVICPPGHPLEKAKRIEVRDIVEHPLLLPTAATNARQRITATLEEASCLGALNAVIESSTTLVLARYVGMGLGVAISSISPQLADELRTGGHGHPPLVVREVRSLFGEEPIVIARRKGGYLFSHVDGFRQLTLSSLHSFRHAP